MARRAPIMRAVLARGFAAEWERKLDRLDEYLEGRMDDLTARMQSGAKWTDDTGRARRSLKAEHALDRTAGGARVTVTLFYDDPEVTYGRDLEWKAEGKYAIVRPTAQIVRRELPREIAGRLRSRA
jgi:hypothetical protein